MAADTVALMPGATRGVIAALRTGRPGEAERLAQGLCQIEPTHAEARFLLGVARAELGRSALALADWSGALALDPAYAPAHIHRGRLWQRRRSWTDAIESFRSALTFDARALDAWLRLSVCLMQAGRTGQSRAWLERLVVRWPTHGQSHVLLGTLARQDGAMDRAADYFARAIALDPGAASAHFEQALLRFAANDLEGTRAALGCSLALDPHQPHGWLNLGIVHKKAGRDEAAVDALARACSLAPEIFEAHHELALALMRLGRMERAVEILPRALALRPDHADAHHHLGAVRLELERFEAAEAALRCAVALKPDGARSWMLLGASLTGLSRLAETRACFHRGLALLPDHRDSHFQLGKLLDREGEAPAALCHFHHAVALDPEHVEARWALLLAMTADPATDPAAVLHFQQRRAARWPRNRVRRPANVRDPANLRDPERRLRIGYVGRSYFSVVNDLTTTALRARDPQLLEQIMFAAPLGDPDHPPVRDGFDDVIDVSALDDDSMAERIRAAGIDILVDMDASRPRNRLAVFAQCPAPVQATWVEAFYTTGLAEMEYLITDAMHVAPDEALPIVETPVRLPDSRFCYAPPPYAPEPAAPPSLAAGQITFGSFNALNKLTPEVTALWAEILRQVEGSRLLLKRRNLAHPEIAGRYRARFAAHGIAAERLILRGHSPHDEMLGEYGDVDIALDPFPYNGGRSSCEALWMGVPLVALRGDRMIARQSASILGALGRAEWIAADTVAYRDIAVGLARDPQRLSALRHDQRQMMKSSALCDARRFARNLEQAYRWMWRRWCAH